MSDTSPEIEKMQFEMMMKLGSEKRIALGCEMFMAARELIIASLPENLSEREFKKLYYERMYGEPLPEDFFKGEVEIKSKKVKLMKKFLSLIFSILLFASFAKAQTAEVTISLNEQFFEALLDAIFKNMNPPEFPLASASPKSKVQSPKSVISSFSEDQSPKSEDQGSQCNESIRLQREIDGVKTAVRFQNGRIFAPIAFTGTYNPPLIGCIEFSGVAETNIALEFDRQKQALVGRAQVLNVNMSGTGGLGGGLLAGVVQNSIDKKVNPMQILQLEKVSFIVPIQNSGALRMRAVGIKNEIGNGVLNVKIAYEFQKAQ